MLVGVSFITANVITKLFGGQFGNLWSAYIKNLTKPPSRKNIAGHQRTKSVILNTMNCTFRLLRKTSVDILLQSKNHLQDIIQSTKSRCLITVYNILLN